MPFLAYYSEAEQPVGKPVRQKSPLGRLICLVFFIFRTSFLRLKNYIFGTASTNPFREMSGIFHFCFTFCAKKQKGTNFSKFLRNVFLVTTHRFSSNFQGIFHRSSYSVCPLLELKFRTVS